MAGSVKLGQPLPESNLVVASNSTAPHPAPRYEPSSLVWTYFPLKGRSVAACRNTSYCSGESSSRHSSSDLVTSAIRVLLCKPFPGQRLQPLVVDLAGRAAADGLDHQHAAGRLVARQLAADVLDQLLVVDGGTRGRFDDGADRFAEPLVRQSDAHRVAHGRVLLQHLFHFFRIDLLAAGVDDHRPAAQQLER